MKMKKFIPGEELFKINNNLDSLFFVIRGKVSLITDNKGHIIII